MADTAFHPHMEGHTNSLAAPKYGSDAPFWRTSMGQDISSFGVNRISHEQNSPGEEQYRQIQASIHPACDFQEIMHRLDRVLATPAPHTESISTRLPRNMDRCPMAELGASTNGHPAYGETSRNPGQTSNFAPAILNSRFVSSHPILSMDGGKPSVTVVSIPSNDGGQPMA